MLTFDDKGGWGGQKIPKTCLRNTWMFPYATLKCKHYLLGMQEFTIITDHKPLLGVWKKAIPDIVNTRLRRLKEKTTEYQFSLEWREGKLNEIADALSRATVFPPNEGEDTAEICNHSLHAECDPILKSLVDAANNCIDYQKIVKAVKEVKNPKRLPTTHPGRSLNSVWSDLSIQDGLIVVNGTRIFIPEKERKAILKKLHIAHCGTTKTILLAKEHYYWRGMASEIKAMVHECTICRPFLNSRPQEELIPGINARSPMDELGSDLFQIGKNYYIVVVDRFSGFPVTVERLTSLDTKAIIKIMTKEFNTYGWPCRIRTDNGPQYRTEFTNFCKSRSIVHECSSPHFAQSNGLSEAAVKQMKFLMKKVKENLLGFAEAKLEWVNTPNESGKSPAQMFFGRRLRTQLPHLADATNLDPSNALKGAQKRKNNTKKWEPRRNLNELEIGQKVLVQDPITLKWDKQGRIKNVRKGKRSYEVRLSNNKLYIRNKRFIRPDNSTSKETEEVEDQNKSQNDQERQPLRRSKRLKQPTAVVK